ncbi:MAG: peptidoglycan editing factor PgeF [Patescibacteria group bacterium]
MITFDQDSKIFYSTLINEAGLFSGFATKQLGDGKHHVDSIFRFLNDNAINYQKVVIMEQIHSVNVAKFDSNSLEKLEKIEETDGVYTCRKGVVLTAVTADCVPITFADKDKQVIGISHQGWRGSVKRLPQKMVSQMVASGAVLKNIKVAIGPAIGMCCYDVEDDRYFEFRSEFGDYADKIFHRSGGKMHLNLALLNYLLMLEKGIPGDNIDFFPFCTKCDKNRFFSFRRDKKEDFGEMFSFIMIK